MDYTRIANEVASDLEGQFPDRDLTTINKVPRTHAKKIIITNTVTGETIETDTTTMRLSRMRRRVFSWAEVQKKALAADKQIRMVMIGLTYKGIEDWRPNHIRDYTKSLKRKLGSKLLALAWVGELQKRGAPHYHMILIVKKGCKIPLPDKSGMWRHGSSRIETARTPFYLVSYTKKAYQKEGAFPKGMRIFSVWVSDEWVGSADKWLMRLSGAPKWLRNVLIHKMDDLPGWKRSEGGGWLIQGELYKSFFKVRVVY